MDLPRYDSDKRRRKLNEFGDVEIEQRLSITIKRTLGDVDFWDLLKRSIREHGGRNSSRGIVLANRAAIAIIAQTRWT